MTGQSFSAVGSGGSGGSLSLVLDETRVWFSRHIKVNDEDDLDLIALWVVHTHLCEETYTTPRLLIDSPVPGSGKTTLLEHLAKFSKRPVQAASVSSAAVLARATASEIRTLLIDEVDRTLNPKRPGVEDLLAVINSGCKRGAVRLVSVPRGKGDWEMAEMPTFSPVAIAGNTPLLPDDTRSRCIVVRLMPDVDGTAEPSDWEFLDAPALDLAKKIEQAADDHREAVRLCRPELPKGCVNRLKERWAPLKRIAEVAGPEWSSRVDRLIIKDLESISQQAADEDLQVSVNVQIMKDLFLIFEGQPGFWPTTKLVAELVRRNPGQWSSLSYYGKDLNVQRFGRILNNVFNVQALRPGGPNRGYHSDQFVRIWRQLGISSQKPTEPTEPPEPTADPEDELF